MRWHFSSGLRSGDAGVFCGLTPWGVEMTCVPQADGRRQTGVRMTIRGCGHRALCLGVEGAAAVLGSLLASLATPPNLPPHGQQCAQQPVNGLNVSWDLETDSIFQSQA